MYLVILIEPSDPMRDILTLNLQNYLGLTVVAHKDIAESITLMEHLKNVSLVIARITSPKDQIAEKLIAHKESSRLKYEIVLLGETKNPKIKEACTVLEHTDDWKIVIRSVAKMLGITAEAMAQKVVPEYFPLPAKFLLMLPKAPCDIFIRIKKDEEFHFVKRIHENDAFSKEDINRYISMGLQEFYVSKNLRLNVTNIISDHLISLLKKDDQTTEERVDTTGKAFDFVNDQIREVGFNSMTTQLVEGVVDSMSKTIASTSKQTQLFNLTRQLLKNSSSLAYRHSHLISLIASTIVKRSEWGNEEQVKKIAFVAFFHDITLDKDNLVMIHNDEDLKKAHLSHHDKERVLNHCSDAARLIFGYPNLPLGAEVIIRQHHGVSNGIGFANHVPPSISPLAAVFMTAEQFVLEMMKKDAEGVPLVPIQLIGKVREKLTGAQVRKALTALEQSFKPE